MSWLGPRRPSPIWLLVGVALTGVLLWAWGTHLLHSPDDSRPTAELGRDATYMSQAHPSPAPTERKSGERERARAKPSSRPSSRGSRTAEEARPPRPGTEEANRTAVRTPPRKEEVRGETARAPHSTPPSLIAHADRIAQRMEQAGQDHESQRRLFKDLSQCALDASGATSARALCYQNASDLARKEPSLADSFQALKRRAPGEITRLAGLLD